MYRIVGSIFVFFAAMAQAGCGANKTTTAAPGRDGSRARELNDKAFVLIDQGKLPEAEKLLREAVNADPMFGPARNNLGLVYYETGRLYEAAWEFENAVRLLPYQPEPRNNLGLVLEKAGKLTNAAESYAKARELEPDNPEYIANLARARVRRGDRDSETASLLEEVVMKDSRPQWNDWARLNLHRLRGLQQAATTQP
jgi:Flp pilus assembly protein TadD